MAAKKVVDVTQQAEGEAAQWVNEPLAERHADLIPQNLLGQIMQNLIWPKKTLTIFPVRYVQETY